MTVALLVLIVFILLFGAGMVKGVLANAAAFVGGFLILSGLVLWVGSLFGKNGPEYVVFGGLGLLLLLAIVAKGVELTGRQPALPPSERYASAAPTSSPEPPAVQKVWGWYADDIREKFSPASRDRARAFLTANDANGLDRFCRAEMERLSEQTDDPEQSA